MPATVCSAAIYARISSDQEGTGLGVLRQLEDCRRLCREHGWGIGEEYVDNDVSAFSGKRRPQYERMLEDLQDGRRDAVVVYHPDRLTRRPIELEGFLQVMSAAGLQHVRFVAGGDVDVASGDGLMVLRMLAAVAANESAAKSRRVKRKMEQVASEGRPHGGRRPFGFDDDRVTIRSDEAEVVRQLAARFLAGESLRSLALWLDEEGVRTVTGGPWRTTTLRNLLRSGRIAGLREHNGVVVGPAVWDPIISESDRTRIRAVMEAKKVSGRRAPRRYLLSGLLRCGRCGHTLYSSARQQARRYVCSSGPDHRGCGHLTIVAPPVEELLATAVLYRLDTQELADALAGRSGGDEVVAALSESLSSDREQLEELATMWAAKEISRPEWFAARHPLESRIRDAESRLARVSRNDTLVGLPGNGVELRRQWAGLNLTRQHAIISAVLDHAVISPSTLHVFDASRVGPIWRL